jgi:hypothetical protein
MRRAEELWYVKKQGPEDVYKFIKSRRVATSKIQTAYQHYTKRSSELAYQEYIIRLMNQVAKHEPYTEYAIPANNPANQEIKAEDACLETSIHDLLLEESIDEKFEESATISDASKDKPDILDSEVASTNRSVLSNVVVNDDDMHFESQCFNGSRCGFADGVHEMLIASGKWFYDKLGDPSGATAREDLLTVMEICEELCCFKEKPAAGGTANLDLAQVTTKDELKVESSAVVIQSKWRNYMALRHCAKIRHQNLLNQLKSWENSTSSDDSTCAESDVDSQNSTKKSAIIKCQSAVRKLLALRRVQKLLPVRQTSLTSKTLRLNRKHVAKMGQIELILNEPEENASLTDYSETQSSDEDSYEVGDGPIGDGLGGSDSNGKSVISKCELSRTGDKVSSPEVNVVPKQQTTINSSGRKVIINGAKYD